MRIAETLIPVPVKRSSQPYKVVDYNIVKARRPRPLFIHPDVKGERRDYSYIASFTQTKVVVRYVGKQGYGTIVTGGMDLDVALAAALESIDRRLEA